MESTNSSTKTPEKCCLFLEDPVEIKDKKDKTKWRIIYMYIHSAIHFGHSDCMEALLTLNADPNILNGAMGKSISNKIAKKIPMCTKAWLRETLQTMINFGLSLYVFTECLPEYVCSKDNERIYPITLAMAFQTPESVAILVQKPYGTMSAEASRKLHQQARSKAVEEVDEELVGKLVLAGTNKELLRKEIEQTKRRQLITDSQAKELTNIIKEKFSLQEQTRIFVWSHLSQLNDAVKMGLPIRIMGYLLFENEGMGYTVTKKLQK